MMEKGPPCGIIRQRKIGRPRYRAEVHKAQHLLDQTDLRPTGDHFDLCQRVYRDWNGEADYLTTEGQGRRTELEEFSGRWKS